MRPNPSDLPPIIGLTGFMQSGKNHIASIIAEDYGYRIYGFADALKDLAHRIGWDGTKQPHARYGNFGRGAYNGRLLLQELGVGARDIIGPDVWVNALFERVTREMPGRVVISDVRFQNEADAIRERGGKVIAVAREGYRGDGHVSEMAQAKIETDGFILNTGGPGMRDVVAAVLNRLTP